MQRNALKKLAQRSLRIPKRSRGRRLRLLKERGKPMSNMYPQSIKQWNPFVGCHYQCTYCKRSFQAQLKRWAKNNCRKCYKYIPHSHRERLFQSLPKTKLRQFVFACACSDVTFCERAYLEQIIQVMLEKRDTQFLLQSKNPATFKDFQFPKNVILGTTIETNRSISEISLAPHPYERYKAMVELKHHKKAVTLEPVMDFDVTELLSWIVDINPVWVQIGYDTRKTGLREPPLYKVDQLSEDLTDSGILVYKKLIREPIQ